MKNYHTKNNCVLCGGKKLLKLAKLKDTPLANSYDKTINFKKKKFPLELVICRSCNHVQLKHVVDKILLFSNYLYVSGTSKVFVDHFRNFVKKVINNKLVKKNDFVLEIGSNDGTLLKIFQQNKIKVLGVDPAKNLVKISNKQNIQTLNSFFNFETTKKIKLNFQPPKLIIANNVFAHTNELQEFITNINILMNSDTIFIFEVQYLMDMIKNYYFDMIYHEHTSYHTIQPLIKFFQKYNLIIFKVDKISTHGGSLRFYVKKNLKLKKLNKNILNKVSLEVKNKIHLKSTYTNFFKNINTLKTKLHIMLNEKKKFNKKIIAYGAPAKATTFLYHLDIYKYFDYVIDDNMLKQNKYLPGTNIKIVSNSFLTKFDPDYIIILAWNFSDSIVKNNRKNLSKTAKFLIPFPNLKVINR